MKYYSISKSYLIKFCIFNFWATRTDLQNIEYGDQFEKLFISACQASQTMWKLNGVLTFTQAELCATIFKVEIVSLSVSLPISRAFVFAD